MKTKENNENCFGSQIQRNEIRIGEGQELTQCEGCIPCHPPGDSSQDQATKAGHDDSWEEDEVVEEAGLL